MPKYDVKIEEGNEPTNIEKEQDLLKKAKVKLMKGNIELTCSRLDLVDADQTPDGMVFNFKGGIVIHYTDQYMSIEVKEKIKQAVGWPNGNVEINLSNYKKPAKIVNF